MVKRTGRRYPEKRENKIDLDPDKGEGKVYQFLIDYKLANDGNAPTLREIASHLNTKSTSLVNYYLDKLERFGLIQRIGTASRGINVIGGNYQFPASQMPRAQAGKEGKPAKKRKPND